MSTVLCLKLIIQSNSVWQSGVGQYTSKWFYSPTQFGEVELANNNLNFLFTNLIFQDILTFFPNLSFMFQQLITEERSFLHPQFRTEKRNFLNPGILFLQNMMIVFLFKYILGFNLDFLFIIDSFEHFFRFHKISKVKVNTRKLSTIKRRSQNLRKTTVNNAENNLLVQKFDK